MGKNSPGPTVGKTFVVILTNSCFLMTVISLAVLYVQAHHVCVLEFR
jgi:hypothetical protein